LSGGLGKLFLNLGHHFSPLPEIKAFLPTMIRHWVAVEFFERPLTDKATEKQNKNIFQPVTKALL